MEEEEEEQRFRAVSRSRERSVITLFRKPVYFYA
jgi:hypothetical protein